MRSTLLKYFVLTYAVTWTVFIAARVLAARMAAAGRPRPALLGLIVLPGVFAPGIVAVALTARRRMNRG